MIAAAMAMMAEDERLRRLTNVELVAECLKTDAADYPVAEEMTTRLDPDWYKEEGEPALL
jgi:hypothetical protein